MGTIVLLALVVVEIAMLIASIKVRSNSQEWMRIRTAVSLGETLVLALLMALPVAGIAFDFRWMALLIVLAVRAIIALITFFARSKKASASVPHPTSRMVLNVVGSIIVIALAVVPALVFPTYEGLPTSGEYDVRASHAIMVDRSSTDPFEQDGSYREVPVWFYYPDVSDAEAQRFPLVIFSHGAFGFHESNYSLYTELASHGYVVAALEHPYHSLFSTDTEGKTILVDSDFINQVMGANSTDTSEAENFAFEQEWMQVRLSDLDFALDTIEAAAQTGSVDGEAWYFDSAEERGSVLEALQLANVEKVGLIGHSLGGAASVSEGRLRNEVGAVIDLDGTMIGEYLSYEDGKYTFVEDPYPVPLLSIDNEEHHLASLEAREQGYSYVNNVVLDNADVSANTYFEGSGHMNFTDLPLFSPMLASMLGTGDIDARTCIEQTDALVLAWFDEYLKGSGHATVAESY